MNKIFEPRPTCIKVKDLSELNIEELLKETFCTTVIQTEKRNKDQTVICVSRTHIPLCHITISFYLYSII